MPHPILTPALDMSKIALVLAASAPAAHGGLSSRILRAAFAVIDCAVFPSRTSLAVLSAMVFAARALISRMVHSQHPGLQ
ncbi:hypothetical protein VUR80DRAFT_7265 [Thermomyces stellatus]